MTAPRALGGFLELEIAGVPAVRRNLWFELTRGTADHADFGLARSAMTWLMHAQLRPAARVWVPDFCCAEVPRALSAAGLQVRLYPVDGTLDVNPHDFAQLRRGDAVVGVSWFGRPPPAALRRLAARREDVLWIDDRAQAPFGGRHWAAYSIFSLRKIAGVADGAILTSAADALPKRPRARRPLDGSFVLPELSRFEDVGEGANAEWHALYRRREARLRAAEIPASRFARVLAERLPYAPIRAARRENYALLHEALGGGPLAPPLAANGVPFAYPLLTDDAASAQRRLARRRVFCARHWAALPRGAGAAARELAAREISLPIDQRYGPDDMKRLLDILRAEGLVQRKSGWRAS